MLLSTFQNASVLPMLTIFITVVWFKTIDDDMRLSKNDNKYLKWIGRTFLFISTLIFSFWVFLIIRRLFLIIPYNFKLIFIIFSICGLTFIGYYARRATLKMNHSFGKMFLLSWGSLLASGLTSIMIYEYYPSFIMNLVKLAVSIPSWSILIPLYIIAIFIVPSVKSVEIKKLSIIILIFIILLLISFLRGISWFWLVIPLSSMVVKILHIGTYFSNKWSYEQWDEFRKQHGFIAFFAYHILPYDFNTVLRPIRSDYGSRIITRGYLDRKSGFLVYEEPKTYYGKLAYYDFMTEYFSACKIAMQIGYYPAWIKFVVIKPSSLPPITLEISEKNLLAVHLPINQRDPLDILDETANKNGHNVIKQELYKLYNNNLIANFDVHFMEDDLSEKIINKIEAYHASYLY